MGIGGLYNKSITVKRETASMDAQGSTTRSWSTLGAIRGRARPASARERMAASRYGAEISHIVYCGANEDVHRGDRMEAGSLVLTVVAVRDPGGMGHHLEVDAMEIQHGT